MTTAQVTFTEAELLADHTMAEPLIEGGVRCHGGFDEQGEYVSPRPKFRVPAIEAWQARHRELFGTEVLDIPLDTWPAHVPNVAQARHLIKAGVPVKVVSERLGHGNPAFTIDTYQHVLPGMQAEAARIFESLIAESR